MWHFGATNPLTTPRGGKVRLGGICQEPGYPFHVRVPVEMRAFQQASAPIVFLLHIVGGVINELEIITADSTQIEADNIELTRVEYEVNQEVIMER